MEEAPHGKEVKWLILGYHEYGWRVLAVHSTVSRTLFALAVNMFVKAAESAFLALGWQPIRVFAMQLH